MLLRARVGLLGAGASLPSQIRGSPGQRWRLPSDSGLPRDRGTVPPSESGLPGAGAVSRPPFAWGKGAAGPAASSPAGGGGSPEALPLRDKPEVSGDRNTLSWVQGAAQGVVTGGYLG